MLGSYRVIDLSDARGILCGQILADLGADVIQVEPPDGSPVRRLAPFQGDVPGPERSLTWWAYARGKRSIALDLEAADDRELLLRLIGGADFLVESEPPGRLDALGLGRETLEAANPTLVHVSITPFGQDGPKAGFAATDLITVAAFGLAHLNGEAERPPVRCSVPQAHAHAAADAAVGALLAHFERKRSGRGQQVDVAEQESLTLATMFRSLDTPLSEASARRISGGVYVAGSLLRTRYPLRDGWVVLGPAFLPSTGHFMKRLLAWALEEGFGDPSCVEEDWNTFAVRLTLGRLASDAYAATDETLLAFFATKTKDELIEAACKRKLLLAPILDVGEIADSQQLRERGFVTPLQVRGADAPVRFPGPFARFERSPIVYERPPPRLDEHGAEIRAEPPRAPAVSAATGEGDPALPLEGVKILDLFWVLAGPGATRMLADYGAEVVHIESMARPDTLRVIPPYQFNHPHMEGAGGFQSANANKLGLTLDLGKAEGREVALELARWADVVTESFAPGVIDRYDLGWETLRAAKPELVMISSCLLGQTGPWRDLTGFGNLAASVTGFQPLASWPGRPPAGPYGAYTDFIAVRNESDWRALCEVLEAPELESRRDEHAAVDAAIASWTREREASEVEARLQERGVPAHAVLDTPGLFACPQLQHREHYLEIGHKIYQTTAIESSRLRLSRSQPRVPETALHFGRDNRRVLESILGYGPERIADLSARGVLS